VHDIGLVWDEIEDLDFDHFEVWRAEHLPITGVVHGSKLFSISGYYGSWYRVGETIEVDRNPDPLNNKDYVIAAVTEAGDLTVIEVTSTIHSSTPGGFIGSKLITAQDQLAASTKKGYYKDRSMPVGYYDYVIYSIDTNGNYSDPTPVVTKWAPSDITPPPTPTGLMGTRSANYSSVELNWNDMEQYDLKGYIIRRTLNPYGTTPIWETIAITGSNSYTDNDIPRGYDSYYRLTDVQYTVEAYDQDGNIGSAITTGIFEIPIIQGVTVSLDYLSLNIYWDKVLPEISTEAVACLLRIKGSGNWIFMGVSEWPKNFFRIAVDLLPNTDYELTLAVVKNGTHTIIEADTSSTHDNLYITGDLTGVILPGDIICIYDSANQDGTWEIDTSTYSSPNTRLHTLTNLPVEYTINGVDLTRNYITISGDHAADFEGKLVYIYIFKSGGSTLNDGRYRVMSAEQYHTTSTRLFLMEALTSTVIDGKITSGTIVNLTDLLETIQTPIQLIPIPNYDSDTTTPTPPLLLTGIDDPENYRVFLNWTRVAAEDDFYEFQIEINLLGGDFPITNVDTGDDWFLIAGDQSAYFAIGQQIYIYGVTGAGIANNGWHYVTNVTTYGGNTRIWIEAVPSGTITNGKIMTDYAWTMIDKTKNTSLQAYFPYAWDYTYWFRVRAIDRSGNKSTPDGTITSALLELAWNNPYATIANLLTPNGGIYSEYWNYDSLGTSGYKSGQQRKYNITINDASRRSKWFKRYVLYAIQITATTTPAASFGFTLDTNYMITTDAPAERLAFLDRNTFTWETFQSISPAKTIYLWPGVEDIQGNIFMGPITSIITITPTT